MKYTKEEIMQYVEQEDVKFIRLAFCDVFGKLKNIAILPTELERAFENGIVIDASAIEGFKKGIRTDLYLKPDPSTLTVLPWRPQNGRVVRMFCSVIYPDGTPFESDSRGILKNAIDKAAEKGVHFDFGSSIEFYLFKTDENGDRTTIPYDNAGYMDVAPDDKGENVRREICLSLEQSGIIPESSHHENGPGQNEINFRYSDPLTAADNAVTFKNVVASIAYGSGLYADFSPKPLEKQPGSGFHIHFSVNGDGEEDLLPFVIAGIMDKIRDMTLFINPYENSYERFGKHKAPKYISWSEGNRSQLIRVVNSAFGNRKAELRSADASANPYLAFALIIYAGLYGIENRLDLPAPSDVDFAEDDASAYMEYSQLPGSFIEATDAAGHSDFIRGSLPEDLIQTYVCRP